MSWPLLVTKRRRQSSKVPDRYCTANIFFETCCVVDVNLLLVLPKLPASCSFIHADAVGLIATRGVAVSLAHPLTLLPQCAVKAARQTLKRTRYPFALCTNIIGRPVIAIAGYTSEVHPRSYPLSPDGTRLFCHTRKRTTIHS